MELNCAGVKTRRCSGPLWQAGQAWPLWLPWRGGGPAGEPAPCHDRPPGGLTQEA